MTHSFEEKTFTHLTYCDHCKQLLWGVRKQGLQCKDCGYTCHRKCMDSAAKCSSATPTRFLDDTSSSDKNKDSRAEKYLRQLKQRAGSEDEIVTPSSSSTSSSTKSKVQPSLSSTSTEVSDSKEGTIQHLYKIVTSEKFQTLLADAATNEEEPACAYLANQAALNPQIAAKNFTRFVSRCGPVFAFRDELLLLLSWENRVDTFVSLLVYCLICLHPKLLFFIPQVIFLYFILASYPKNKEEEQQKTQRQSKTEKHGKKKVTIAEEKDKSKKPTAPIPEKSSSTPSSSKSTAVEGPSLFNMSTLFQLVSDGSPEYMKNLQNIQNSMGEVSDAYDWIMMQHSNHFNWSSATESSFTVQALVVFSLLLGIIIYFIPINMIFLFLGLTVYSINTRFAKYVMRELKPYMIQWIKTQVEDIKQWYSDFVNKLENQERTLEISVYENQRWWPLRGYLHEMMENERSPWSNYSGTVYMPIITEVAPAKGYQWKETSEWKLDIKGPWVNDYLGIGN